MCEKAISIIGLFENGLWEKMYHQKDGEKLFSNFTGLLTGFISEIDKPQKSFIIYDYSKLAVAV